MCARVYVEGSFPVPSRSTQFCAVAKFKSDFCVRASVRESILKSKGEQTVLSLCRISVSLKTLKGFWLTLATILMAQLWIVCISKQYTIIGSCQPTWGLKLSGAHAFFLCICLVFLYSSFQYF